jgi:L-seryl-tRNA(Ser) seleniumtransferase
MPATTTIYEELGLTPVINARGHQTVLGGSTPSPHVKAAMERAERYFVDMQRLLQRSGEIIAELIGAEAAYVTPGAAAALALGTAACVTGSDMDAIARLPDTTGRKHKVLIQNRQHYSYERATTIVGTTLVDVGDELGTTAAQLEAALGPDVATVLYPAHMDGTPGTLPLVQVLQIAHGKGVPVLVDAAGQVFPLERFMGYTKMGADLVCFGAKYLGGPNSSGILCGRKDLVEAAALQGFIGFETAAARKSFGRPLKLDRQEIIAVVTAVQDWMTMDHEKRLADQERVLKTIAGKIEGLPGVTLEHVRRHGAAPRVLQVNIDPATARRNAADVEAGLRQGSPAVYVGSGPNRIDIGPATLVAGDEEIVAQRLHDLLA